jgi:hypothetical protein
MTPKSRHGGTAGPPLAHQRVGGGHRTYSPMMYHTPDWWDLGLDGDLHDASVAFWCHGTGERGPKDEKPGPYLEPKSRT